MGRRTMWGRTMWVGSLAVAIPLGLLGAGVGVAATVAQSTTPGPAACRSEPRSLPAILALVATPTGAAAPAPGEERPPAGIERAGPAPRETIVAIRATLGEIEACFIAGEPLTALALFSDDFVRAFAASGSPAEVEEAIAELATPRSRAEVAIDVPSVRADDLRLLPDGRVGALLPPPDGMKPRGGNGDSSSFIVFIEVDDRWLIDELVQNGLAGGTAVAVVVPPTAPPPARSVKRETAPPTDDPPLPADPDRPVRPDVAVLQDAAARLGLTEGELSVVLVEPREWSDSSLGCPEPGMVYAQVITPGYLVIVAGGGQELEYHTDESGNFAQCTER